MRRRSTVLVTLTATALMIGALLASPAQARPVVRMDVPQPPVARMGEAASVKVFTYSGYHCTLNDQLRRENPSGGWLFWSFPVTWTGLARMKIWCGKGSESSAVVRYIRLLPALPGWKVVKTYHGFGTWIGRDIWMPTSVYRMYWWYTCGGSTEAMVPTWHGTSNGTEGPHLTQPGSGLWYGHKGARHGTLTVSTAAGCEWRVAFMAYY